MPTKLLTLATTFTVEEGDEPAFDDLLVEVETRIHELEGVYGTAADVAVATRTYTLVAEVECDGCDVDAAQEEMELAVRTVVRRFVEEPRGAEPLVDEVD